MKNLDTQIYLILLVSASWNVRI